MFDAVSTRSIARATLSAIVLSACVVEPLELDGKRCPCAGDWVCDEPRDVCVRRTTMDATSGDARVLDSATRDAGARDSGPPDLGIDAGPGPTRCDDVLADALFCDGFEDTDPESGVLDPWSFALIIDGTGEIATVSDPVRHGARALRATTFEAGARAAIGVRQPDLPDDGTMWVRMWLYLPSEVAVDSISLLYIGNDDGSQGLSAQTYGDGRAAQWIGSADQWHGTETELPRDQWTCLQYRVEISDTDGEVELFVDGASAGVFSGVDTLANGGYAGLEAGIEYTGDAQGPLTLFVDEVAVARDEMPCE